MVALTFSKHVALKTLPEEPLETFFKVRSTCLARAPLAVCCVRHNARVLRAWPQPCGGADSACALRAGGWLDVGPHGARHRHVDLHTHPLPELAQAHAGVPPRCRRTPRSVIVLGRACAARRVPHVHRDCAGAAREQAGGAVPAVRRHAAARVRRDGPVVVVRRCASAPAAARVKALSMVHWKRAGVPLGTASIAIRGGPH
jgi:hypothetical protein